MYNRSTLLVSSMELIEESYYEILSSMTLVRTGQSPVLNKFNDCNLD